MMISIGADHRGFELKNLLKREFATITVDREEKKITWHDVGSFSQERSDYPCFARLVCDDITQNRAQFGILVCGSGVGMAIAANRNKGIYAALCWSSEIAFIARADDGMNVLVLSADYIPNEQNFDIVRAALHAWATPTFKGGHYQDRLAMIDADNQKG